MIFFKKIKPSSKTIILAFLILLLTIGGLSSYSFWQSQKNAQSNLDTVSTQINQENLALRSELESKTQRIQELEQKTENGSQSEPATKELDTDEALKLIESQSFEKIAGWNPDFVKNTTGKKLAIIADIPDSVLVKIGVPTQGFVFSNNIVYWVNENKNSDLYPSLSMYNGSEVNQIPIKETNMVSASPIFKNKYMYIFDCSGFDMGCRVGWGVIIDLQNGTFSRATNLTFDFFQKLLPEEMRGDSFLNDEFQILYNKEIYGRYKNSVVKSNGEKFEILFRSLSVGQYASKLVLNTRNNLVYIAVFDARTYYENDSGPSPCLIKNQFAEQDINTGGMLQFTTTYSSINDTENCQYLSESGDAPADIFKNKAKYEQEYEQIESKFKIKI